MTLWGFKLAFAGIWPLVVDWAWPLSAIAALLLIEFFSVAIGTYVPFLDPLLKKFRKDLLWVALVIALMLAYGIKMQRDEAHRNVAKQTVIGAQVHKARTDAHRPVAAGTRGKWDTDK